MRYVTILARNTEWVVHGRNGLAADVAKLAKAGPNVPTFMLLWTPDIGLAQWA